MALVLVLALAAAACVGEVDPSPLDPVLPDVSGRSDDPSTGAPLARPDTSAADCPEVLAEARCGFVVLPEDRTDPSGPVIEVAYALLPAIDLPEREPSVTPLVVLPDGPGLAGIDDAEAWVDSPLREGRELVLLDPRGTGRSFPSLDCGEAPRPGALPPDLVEDCQRTLTALGVDLAAYDIAAIAADVVDLADALGLDGIDLLGIGHGATVGLAVLAAQPGLLRALVLDSPIPPEADPLAEGPVNSQAALNRLLDECAEQPACSDLGPIQQDLEAAVASLNLTPAEPEDGVGVSGADLVLTALAALRGADGPGVVPAALSLATRGEVRAAMAVLEAAAGTGEDAPAERTSEGLLLSAQCRDEVPTSAADTEVDGSGLGAVGLVVAADVAELVGACATWGAGQAGPGAAEAVTGRVPTLVLTGEFDPLSPPAWGAAVAARLDDATVVQVDGAGHRVVDVDGCTQGLVTDFLANPRAAVDGTCAADRAVEFDLSP